MPSIDNFEFKLLGSNEKPFKGYISSTDKTKVSEQAAIRGSLNMYKKRSGNWANRPGLKRRGSADSTDAGVVASYEWKNSLGNTLPIRVADNKLQVESDIVTSGTLVWYDLLLTSTVLNPAVSLTRFNFAKWWDDDEKNERLLMCRGDSAILHWSGGIALVSSTSSNTGTILTATVSSSGSAYAVGDILNINGGGPTSIAYLRVTSVTSGAIVSVEIVDRGSGYSDGTLGVQSQTGSGTGATFILTTGVSYTITKTGTDTWAQAGFATNKSQEKVIIISGVEYTYYGGYNSTTLTGFTTDTSGIAANSVVIQSVISDTLASPATGFVVDFMAVLKNQLGICSENSRIIYISASQNTDTTAIITNGFLDFSNSGSYIDGDPDLAILDDVPVGIIARTQSFYASAGTSDWYEITPNFAPPVSFTGSEGVSRFIITKVEKFAGTGLCAALSHEFITIKGNNIIYLGQDHQLHVIGNFSNVEGLRFPILSSDVYEELQEEDFSNGHIRSIEDIIYLTAPTTGRHWLFRYREDINENNSLVSNKEWLPPHASGISRVAEIDGVAYGHSNANPQIYQIWDTNQWYDDHPSDEPIAYTSALRMAYRNHGRKQGIINLNKIYVEGYMREGTELLGNVYYDYQGSTDIKPIIINSNTDGTRFFIGNSTQSLGDSSLGSNPLGIPIIPESSEQDFVPKFRSICGVKPKGCFEYSLEFYTTELYARWEVSCLGTNADLARNQQAGFIQK